MKRDNSAPKFFQAVLHPLNDKELSIITKGQTIAERMGTENAECPCCGKNEWWLLPTMSKAVKEGGKPYMECLNCSHITHL